MAGKGVTTNRNNLNRPRIFSFRAKLQTPQSVSTPSCATMKPNRGMFQERKPETAQNSAVSRHATPSLSTERQKKTAHFSAVSGRLTAHSKLHRAVEEPGAGDGKGRDEEAQPVPDGGASARISLAP